MPKYYLTVNRGDSTNHSVAVSFKRWQSNPYPFSLALYVNTALCVHCVHAHHSSISLNEKENILIKFYHIGCGSQGPLHTGIQWLPIYLPSVHWLQHKTLVVVAATIVWEPYVCVQLQKPTNNLTALATPGHCTWPMFDSPNWLQRANCLWPPGPGLWLAECQHKALSGSSGFQQLIASCRLYIVWTLSRSASTMADTLSIFSVCCSESTLKRHKAWDAHIL